MRQTGDLGVLLGDTLLSIDENEADVAALNSHGGPQNAVFFDVVIYLGLFPHTGGVDEIIFAILVLEVAVDGVAGGAGYIADDNAFLAQNTVRQAGFTYIGLSDNGHLYHVGVVLLIRFRRKILDAFVQQIAGAVAVNGGDSHGVAQTQVVELIEIRVDRAHRVHLVHRQHDGLTAALKHTGHLLVGGSQAGLDIRDEDNDVGVVDGDLGLLPHEGQNLAVCIGLDAAGVHQAEPAAHPLALTVDTVTGDAGGVLYDGQPPADDLIEQHGLAHVGASHDRYQR